MSTHPVVARLRRLTSRRRDEKGAYAVLFSMILVLLIALAAISVDIASQVSAKQQLKDTMDAAAHAGALALPERQLEATQIARTMAQRNDPTADVDARLYCVIASTGGDRQPNLAQIPSTCDPGGTAPYAGTVCNDIICAIPCIPSPTNPMIRCNTIQVSDTKEVDYAFAPAIGHDQGSTGAVVSTACKGTCGSEVPNPMDVVVMADRTASMAAPDRARMVQGIREMLETMTPSQQYVAFGTLHKSVTSSSTCKSNPYLLPSGRNARDYVTQGTWIPVPFSNDYLNGEDLNTNSQLVKAVTCLPESPSGQFGTHLASALKAAARYVLGIDPNNLGSLPNRPGATKAVIFETDGMPDEVWTSSTSSRDLNVAGDIGGGLQSADGEQPCIRWDRWGRCTGYGSTLYKNTNGQKGCDNFSHVARQAKARNVTIVTIGFGDATIARCKKYEPHTGTWASRNVRDVLAEAASPHPVTGQPSVAVSNCSTAAQREVENGNGDFYFCAASGDQLGPIFKTAMSALASGVKFVKLPR